MTNVRRHRLDPGFSGEEIGYVIVSLEAPLGRLRTVNASTGDERGHWLMTRDIRRR